jgi:hypothetical protein
VRIQLVSLFPSGVALPRTFNRPCVAAPPPPSIIALSIVAIQCAVSANSLLPLSLVTRICGSSLPVLADLLQMTTNAHDPALACTGIIAKALDRPSMNVFNAFS